MNWSAEPNLERYVLWRLTEDSTDLMASQLEAEDFTTREHADWFKHLAAGNGDGFDGLLGVVSNEALERAVKADDFFFITRREGRRQFLQRCDRLRTLRYQRELAKAGMRIAEAARDARSAYQAMDDEQDYLDALRARTAPLRHSSLVTEYRNGLGLSRVPTTYPRFDARVKGGIPRGGIMAVIARPSVGKTTFTANMALQVARSLPDEHVVFATLEMPADMIIEKLMQAYFQVPDIAAARIAEGTDERSGHRRQLKDFEEATKNMHIWDDVRDIATLHRRCAGLDGQTALVVLDYIQRVHVDAARSEYEQVTQVVRSVRPMAVGLRAAVVICSQLSRSSKPNQCPALESSRGSGAVEEDGDIIVGLWRPGWKREQSEERQFAELKASILKNKWGYASTVEFRLDLHCQRTEEVASSVQETLPTP